MNIDKRIIILVVLVFCLGGLIFLAKKTLGAVYDFSRVSLNVLGIETEMTTKDMFPVRIVQLRGDYSKGKVELVWRSSKMGNVSGYRIYRGSVSGMETIVGASSFAFFTDTDVEEGEIYYYRVSAINDLGEGFLSPAERVSTE